MAEQGSIHLTLDAKEELERIEKIASTFQRSMILFATISGFNAENESRKDQGYAPAYDEKAFVNATQDCFPEDLVPKNNQEGEKA